MSVKRLVIALGGNALSDSETRRSSVAMQADAARQAFGVLAEVISATDHVLISHGNGPQIGSLLMRSELSAEMQGLPRLPLDSLVADTAGGLGYTLAKELRNALADRDASREVATLVIEVLVDATDLSPTKPIGQTYPVSEQTELESRGWDLMATNAGTVRRAVASPAPEDVLELGAIRLLYEAGVVVIAGGGGGVPVAYDANGNLHGVEGVIDKDLVAALIASRLEAEALIILTDVERVCLDFGGPEERALGNVTTAELAQFEQDGQFPAGSMGPKVRAALTFVEQSGGWAVISSLERAADALAGHTGTRVLPHTSLRGQR